jgi:hypothetical protein
MQPGQKFIHTEISVKGKIETIFNCLAVNGEKFPNYFTGSFPLIPPIKEIIIPPGKKIEVGLIRSVKLGDGTIVKERILEHNSPYTQKYEMAEMNLIQSLLFTNMQGKYTLKELNGSISVNWDYTFFPKRNLLSYLLVPIVVWGFQNAMNKCLKNMKSIEERG